MARRRSGTPHWGKLDGHPPFQAGDRVGLNGNYNYPGWAHGETRVITAVDYDETSDRWTLAIPNPQSPVGQSWYNPRNFSVYNYNGGNKMAYERTKFFAMKLENQDQSNRLAFPDYGKWEENITTLQDSKYQVQQEVAKIIQHGDKYVVVQLVALIEGEEPRPPIRITEYK